MCRCLLAAQTRYEGEIDVDWLTTVKKYIKCFKKEANTCTAIILQHFIANFEAYLKHLREDKNWKFEEMVVMKEEL